jgi:hypothetical protein
MLLFSRVSLQLTPTYGPVMQGMLTAADLMRRK